ncbi:MAG TPA: CrcB family protein [Galbitalea sp.]|jgi:CrcB protein
MRALIAVFIGGAIGTAIRLSIDAAIYHTDTEFPLSTLLINILGSFVLAVFVTRLWPVAPPWLRAGLGPGLVGGFTTFSAVMVSMVTLAANSEIVQALGYLGITLVLGFGAAALGFLLGRRRDSAPTIEASE